MSRHTHVQRHIICMKCFWSYISSAYLPAEEPQRDAQTRDAEGRTGSHELRR